VRRSLLVALAWLALCTGWMSSAAGADVSLTQVPPEARETLARIKSGGPFPYRQDGVVFGNREHMLPRRERGYYREYTVPTPGARDRGPRRIVAGGEDPRSPLECWYTDDHYKSFRHIRE